MSKTINVALAKAAVVVVALALAFSVVAPAAAQSSDEDLAVLLTLLTQLSQSQSPATVTGGATAGAAVCPYTWTTSLGAGDSGPDVMALQQFLNSMSETQVAPVGSIGGPGSETDYYGPATGAAVSNFQQKYRAEILTPIGLAYPTTYFGNATREHANRLCSGTAGSGVTTAASADDAALMSLLMSILGEDAAAIAPVADGDSGSKQKPSDRRPTALGGGEGDIANVREVSSDDSDINEGELGAIFAFEAEIEGDVEIDRIDFYLEVDDGSAVSEDADDYFTEAQLWVDGKEIASLDVDDFDEDDYTGNVRDGSNTDEEYRLRFSNLGLAYQDGNEPEFVLALVADTNLDSTDLGGDWWVALPEDGIRFVDGEGFTGKYPSSAVEEKFGFEQEETGKLRISSSPDNPDQAVIEVDTEDRTDNVEVFVFEIEEENGVDVTIEDITVTVTTTGEDDEEVVVAEATLFHGSNELDSQSVPTGGKVDFENIDLEIAGDETVELTVELSFEDTNDGKAYSDGTQVQVAYTSLNAEDEHGNDEGDMTLSGSARSEQHSLNSKGFNVVLVGYDNDTLANDDTKTDDDKGEMKLTFELTAFGEDLYLPAGVSATASDATSAFAVSILKDGTAETTFAANSLTLSVSAADSNIEETHSYYLAEGETEEFTITAIYDVAASGFYTLRLDKIKYTDTDKAALSSSEASGGQGVTSLNIETGELYVQN